MSTTTAPGTGWRVTPPEYAGVPSDQKGVKTRIGADARHGAAGSAGDEPLATFLGLFSLGLGLWELTDPRGVAEASGVPYPGILRAYGVREIASGLGILSNRRPANFFTTDGEAGVTRLRGGPTKVAARSRSIPASGRIR
ncbi:hypothetical protein J0H58_31920 [bacterium]|nr:hypothetical protein [bacterium]